MSRSFPIALLLSLLAWLAACGRTSETAEPVVASSGSVLELHTAMNATEEIRAQLSADRTDGLAGPGMRAAEALDAAGQDLSPGARAHARTGAVAARAIAAATDLDAARTSFGELNRSLFVLAASDPGLQEGWHAFLCPMASGFQKWFQSDPSLQNPYFGKEMSTCGSATGWGDGVASETHDPDEVAFWTCPMHPSVHEAGEGRCPICGMALVPVTWSEAETGVVRIDQERRQAFGVRTATVSVTPLTRVVRATGRVVPAETGLFDVSLRVDGWIRDLRVDQIGQQVRRGEVLFTLYSPELYAGEQELLAVRDADPALADAARDRLRLWGLTAEQVAGIESRGVAVEDVPILAPASGWVLDKDAVAGMRAMAGQRLFRLASLDPIWVEADVYEADLPWVAVGQHATATLPHVPGATFDGEITFLHPVLDPVSRTRRARVVLANADLALLPEMAADVALHVQGAPVLTVPEEAVIYTGPRRIVFVDEGDDRLAPREVTLGRKGDGGYEVLGGLVEGERVVVSGNFLVAAESRIRSSGSTWGGHDAQ